MLKLFRLNFTTPLHISNVREDYAQTNRRIHSDTLYSAIIQTWALLGKNTWLAALEQQNGEPNFALSSLFPYTTSNQQTVYFLPRPLKSFHLADVEREFKGKMKLLKEIEWLDLECYKMQIQQPEGYAPKLNEVQEVYLSKHKIDINFLDSQVNPHVTIPREGGDANPFYVEQLRFTEGSGMYGLFHGTDEAFTQFATAMYLLQDEGIGTDKSMGYGRFEFALANDIETENFNQLFNSTTPAAYYTNLSLYNPENYESLQQMLPTNDQTIGFEWTKRGGWITTSPYLNLRKKAIYMFSEGSIFKSDTPIVTHGASQNVKPSIISPNEHPIWRVGKSLFVPIQTV